MILQGGDSAKTRLVPPGAKTRQIWGLNAYVAAKCTKNMHFMNISIIRHQNEPESMTNVLVHK